MIVLLSCHQGYVWWRIFFCFICLNTSVFINVLLWNFALGQCVHLCVLICNICTQIQNPLTSHFVFTFKPMCQDNETIAWNQLVLRFPSLAFDLYFQSQLVDQGVYAVWASVTHFTKPEIPTSSASALFPGWEWLSSATEGLVFPYFDSGEFCKWFLCGQISVHLALFSPETS